MASRHRIVVPLAALLVSLLALPAAGEAAEDEPSTRLHLGGSLALGAADGHRSPGLGLGLELIAAEWLGVGASVGAQVIAGDEYDSGEVHTIPFPIPRVAGHVALYPRVGLGEALRVELSAGACGERLDQPVAGVSLGLHLRPSRSTYLDLSLFLDAYAAQYLVVDERWAGGKRSPLYAVGLRVAGGFVL